MRLVESFPNKVIIDSEGNEVGKVDDIEIDLKAQKLVALVVKGKGEHSNQYQDEITSVQKNVTVTMMDDLVIPFEDIQAIGKYVILKKSIKEEREKPPKLVS